MLKKQRKRRSDRNHVIYRVDLDRDFYIGVTVKEIGKTPLKSALRRWQKHVSRAKREDKDWKLCRVIRKNDLASFRITVVSVVRGKTEAHKAERLLINKFNPTLNTDKRKAEK